MFALYNKNMKTIKTELEEHRGRTYKVIIDVDGKRYRVGRSVPQYVQRGSIDYQLEWIKKNPKRQKIQIESRDTVKRNLEKKYPPEKYPPFFSDNKEFSYGNEK